MNVALFATEMFHMPVLSFRHCEILCVDRFVACSASWFVLVGPMPAAQHAVGLKLETNQVNQHFFAHLTSEACVGMPVGAHPVLFCDPIHRTFAAMMTAHQHMR